MATRLEDPPSKSRISSLWWWVMGAFLLLTAAWATLIFIAQSNQPERIEPPRQEAS